MRQEKVIEDILQRLDRLEDRQSDTDEEIDSIRHKINLCRNDADEDEVEPLSYSPDDDSPD